VAKSVLEIPVILYNIQGRTGVNIETPTLVRLVNDCPNIVGVKEASGNIAQMMDVINEVRMVNSGFIVLSGDDNMTFSLMCLGGDGVISVASNLVPGGVSLLVKGVQQGLVFEAQDLHYELLLLFKNLFIETNPIMVKAAMALMGKISPEIRSPMTEPSPANLEKLKAVLRQYKLIS
jgi:4-hydroxy-tetrahydrodipicolinate synthase